VENIANIWQDHGLNMQPVNDEQTPLPIDPPDVRPTASPGVEPPPKASPPLLPLEVGGRDGPEPTRFGDWEKAGRCIDF
jgi:hypothetical protein